MIVMKPCRILKYGLLLLDKTVWYPDLIEADVDSHILQQIYPMKTVESTLCPKKRPPFYFSNN